MSVKRRCTLEHGSTSSWTAWDWASHGSWLKVPLGKLASERTVPLDAATLAALDEWIALRGPQRVLPPPRLSRPADFLFTKRGPPPDRLPAAARARRRRSDRPRPDRRRHASSAARPTQPAWPGWRRSAQTACAVSLRSR